MATILKYVRLTVAAPSIAIVFAIGAAVWPQSPALTITLTGQSMIRSDIRVTRSLRCVDDCVAAEGRRDIYEFRRRRSQNQVSRTNRRPSRDRALGSSPHLKRSMR